MDFADIDRQKKDELPPNLCWFPWFPKDFITSDSVGRMNDAQIVAYVMLLNRQWLSKDGILPDDIDILSRYAMHDLKHDAMHIVLDRFPHHPNGGRANLRMLSIYREQHEKHGKRVKAANKRWKKYAKHNAMDDALDMQGTSDSISGSYIYSSEEGSQRGDLADTYGKYPLLALLHAEPELRSITLENYLRCIQARSKDMDFDAAIKEFIRKASLKANISDPADYLDNFLSKWELKHHPEEKPRKKRSRFED